MRGNNNACKTATLTSAWPCPFNQALARTPLHPAERSNATERPELLPVRSTNKVPKVVNVKPKEGQKPGAKR